MMEALTLLGSLLPVAAGTILSGVTGNEAHLLFRRWMESANDPETGLPRNHDLNKASREKVGVLQFAHVVSGVGAKSTFMVDWW